jgi:hypothetical protein
MGRGRRVALVVAVPVAAAALAACGSDDAASEDGGGNVVAAAAADTLAEGSSGFSLDATIDIVAAGRQVTGTFTGEGEFDFAGTQGSYALDLTDLVGQLGVPGSVTGEALRDDTIVYLNVPLISTFLPGVKEWLQIDLGSNASVGGFDLGRFNELVDPSLYLAYLKAASGEVDEVGTEDFDGTQVTHYLATIDLERALEEAPASQTGTIQALIDAGTSSLPVDVWIDDDGLVRRLFVEFAAGDQPGTGSVALELSDFGTDVVVEPPPSDQVTDVAELQGEVGASTS